MTTTVIGLVPTTSGIAALTEPDATGVPFTVIVAVEAVTVGVTVSVGAGATVCVIWGAAGAQADKIKTRPQRMSTLA